MIIVIEKGLILNRVSTQLQCNGYGTRSVPYRVMISAPRVA
jgi:hypothetical protein